MNVRAVCARLCVALLVAAFVRDAVAQRPALEKPRVSIAIGGQSSLIYLPLTIADRLGYFKDEGLSVEISDFQSGAKALQAVVGGSADVVTGVYEHTIRIQGSGQSLTAFVVLAESMQLALAVSTEASSKVKTLHDLKGMRIGVSAPGSTTNMMVDRLLVRAGLKPSDVSIIGVGLGSTAVAAISSNKVDAICATEPAASVMERQGMIKVLVDARDRDGTIKVFGGALPTSVLYAPTSFVKENPRTVQALTNALIRADRWLHQVKPAELLRTVPESFVGGDAATYLFAFDKLREGYSKDGRFPPKGAENTLAALAEFDPKIKPATIRLDETYTNAFADRFGAATK